MEDNMVIWNQVCTTDKKFTKRVKKGKNFYLTAIDAQSQVKRATEVFGPMGYGWGIKNFEVSMFAETETLFGTAIFWYLWEDNVYQFDTAADIKFEAGQDCVKKLYTECVSKSLSRLGFNSDVFEGRFDDNKYVAQNTNDDVDEVLPAAEETKKSGKKSSRSGKVPEPNPQESGILGHTAQEYQAALEASDLEGYFVNFNKLCREVYSEFGQYPTVKESIPKILEQIPLERVVEKNNFSEGL